MAHTVCLFGLHEASTCRFGWERELGQEEMEGGRGRGRRGIVGKRLMTGDKEHVQNALN